MSNEQDPLTAWASGAAATPIVLHIHDAERMTREEWQRYLDAAQPFNPLDSVQRNKAIDDFLAEEISMGKLCELLGIPALIGYDLIGALSNHYQAAVPADEPRIAELEAENTILRERIAELETMRPDGHSIAAIRQTVEEARYALVDGNISHEDIPWTTALSWFETIRHTLNHLDEIRVAAPADEPITAEALEREGWIRHDPYCTKNLGDGASLLWSDFMGLIVIGQTRINAKGMRDIHDAVRLFTPQEGSE